MTYLFHIVPDPILSHVSFPLPIFSKPAEKNVKVPRVMNAIYGAEACRSITRIVKPFMKTPGTRIINLYIGSTSMARTSPTKTQSCLIQPI